MKKLALALLIVCFVLSAGFAQEFKPEVSVTGSAKSLVGFNLDTGIFSLKNDVSAGIKLTLLPKATAEKKQDAGTYGYIKLADFRVIIDDADVFKIEPGVVTAKIVSGPIFVTIMDEGKRDGSNKTKTINAGRFGLPNITDGKILSEEAAVVGAAVVKLPAEAPAGSYLYAGYDTDMLDLTVKVSTLNDYCLAEGTVANDADFDGDYDPIWFIAPAASVTVSGLTVKAGAIFGTQETYQSAVGVLKDFNTGFGANLSYELALNDKIKVVPVAGFDMELNGDADLDIDNSWVAGAGVFAKWGGNDEYDAYMKLTAATCGNTFGTGDDVKYQGGAGFGAQYTNDGDVNVVVQVNEQRGDDGLVPGLGAALGVELFNVMPEDGENMAMSIGGFANYKIGNITPAARFVFTNKATEASEDDRFTLGLGVEVGSIIPNTTLNLDYNTWNLMAADVGDQTMNMGLITASVKVAF